jgi:hypothetical protein
MQKDFHFYLTYALSRKAGIPAKDSKVIAWANQYTDELTKADLYGIQTQSKVVGNWDDRFILFRVTTRLIRGRQLAITNGPKSWLVQH